MTHALFLKDNFDGLQINTSSFQKKCFLQLVSLSLHHLKGSRPFTFSFFWERPYILIAEDVYAWFLDVLRLGKQPVFIFSIQGRLFRNAFLPSPFSFPVRRSALHSPEGTVSIEERGAIVGPLCSMCSSREKQRMSFALNASTNVPKLRYW